MKKLKKWCLGILGVVVLAFIFMMIVPAPGSKESSEAQKATIEQVAVDDLPAYTIIDQTELISGGTAGDILIRSFSKATPISERESVLRRIAKKEGFTVASLYCTMEAYEANYSSSYSEAHPNALEEGSLGSLRDGKFKFTEY